jgi:TonB family protein
MLNGILRRQTSFAIFLALIFAVLIFVFSGSNLLHAQESQDLSESHRKVVSRVAPVYPSLARTMNIHGSVKVEAVVTPGGVVKTTEIKGGHPVLVQSALNAVAKWKWEPAAKETRELVVIQFNSE